MHPNSKKIIGKIRAMQDRTVARGCTEAEALAAAEMIAKLLNEYNLSLTDVEIGGETCKQRGITAQSKHEIRHCLMAVAFFTDCKVWSRDEGFTFFGLPEDVRFAAFLYGVIRAAMDSELRRYQWSRKQNRERNSVKNSSEFLLGMAHRIRERLRELKKDLDHETLATTGRDLVVIKNSVVSQQFAALGMNLRPTSGKAADKNAAGYNAGRDAGGNVGFGRPIASPVKGYLTHE